MPRNDDADLVADSRRRRSNSRDRGDGHDTSKRERRDDRGGVERADFAHSRDRRDGDRKRSRSRSRSHDRHRPVDGGRNVERRDERRDDRYRDSSYHDAGRRSEYARDDDRYGGGPGAGTRWQPSDRDGGYRGDDRRGDFRDDRYDRALSDARRYDDYDTRKRYDDNGDGRDGRRRDGGDRGGSADRDADVKRRSRSPDERDEEEASAAAPPPQPFTLDDVPDADDIAAALGFGGFDSTHGKPVADNQVGPARGGAKVVLKRKYRQYMNRLGGFNKNLDAMK